MAVLDPGAILEMAGEELAGAIIKKINSNIPPPNKPATIKHKGSSKTLIDSGDMVGSIAWRMKKENPYEIECEVGIFDETIAEYARAHEFGYPPGNIPERSFLRSTCDEEGDRILDAAEKLLGDDISRSWEE